MSNLDWGRKIPDSDALGILRRLALAHLAEAATADSRATVLRDMLLCHDYRGLCEYELAYRDDDSVFALIHIRQALGLLTKYQDLPLDVDRERSAWEKFVQAEERCRVTNECFRAWSRGGFQFHPRVEAVLHGVIRKIPRVIGPAPDLSDLDFYFGKGATTDVPKARSNPRTKLAAGFQCSATLLPLVPTLASLMPGWAQFALSGVTELRSLVRDGQLGFVSKTALVHRSIVTEPSLNVMYQRALARPMEKCMRQWGLDTKEQRPNQVLARIGSIDGSLATIDLSSASDTIALELVRHVLPQDWLDLLEAGRTPTVSYKGERIRLEKFSSMGNGYTFPLQTALFYCLATSVAELQGVPTDQIRTYGDDIIIPSECAPEFVAVLRALGFVPNPSKSFWTGKFRESCGADYFAGIDIRPWYAKESLLGADLFALHNFYVEQCNQPFADIVLEYIPEPARRWGPVGFGDGHLHKRNFAMEPHNRQDGFGGYIFDTFSWSSPKYHRVLPGDYLYPAYSLYARRGAEREPRVADVLFPFISRGRPSELVRNPVVRSLLSGWATELQSASTHQCWHRKRQEWRWNTPLPGTSTVKIISIYTLNPF